MLPISPKLLGGIVLACILIAVFLLPDQGTIFDRHLRDQDWEKAYTDLQNMPTEQRAKDPEYFDLWDIRLRRRMMAPDDREAATPLLAEALLRADKYAFPEEFLLEIEQLFSKTLSPSETHQILKPYFGKLPRELQEEFYEQLAKRALAGADPVLATTIYTEWWKQNTSDKETTFHFVNLARGAAQPQLALQAIQQFESGLSEPLHVHDWQMAGLKLTLLRENGLPREALELATAMHEAADGETKIGLEPLLTQLKKETGSAPSVTFAELVEQANREPQNLVLWRKVAQMATWENQPKLARAALIHVVRQAPKDGESAFKVAQMLEWEGQPNAAFDYYLVALDRGIKKTIDRLLALNPGLYRDVELAVALNKAGDAVDLETYGHTLARMFVNLSEFDKASDYYEKVLRLKGEQSSLLREYGLMRLDLGHLDAALKLYSRAAAVDGQNVQTLISIAEAQFRAGKFDDALQTYDQIQQLQPDRKQLENYLRLAESMGRIELAAKALDRFIHRDEDTKRSDYEKLTYFYSILGEREELQSTLREALLLYPDATRMRTRLLYSYTDNKQSAEATALLETFPNLTTDKAFTQIYINLLTEAKRHRDLEHFIDSRLSPQMVAELKLDDLMASIYYETGNTNATMDLYRRRYEKDPSDTKSAMTYAQFLLDAKRDREALAVIETIPDGAEPRALKIAAQLHAQDKDYERALSYQRKYLGTEPPDSGRDWGFLGDILNERGNPAEANLAYHRAIDEMLNTLAHIARTNAPIANAASN